MRQLRATLCGHDPEPASETTITQRFLPAAALIRHQRRLRNGTTLPAEPLMTLAAVSVAARSVSSSKWL